MAESPTIPGLVRRMCPFSACIARNRRGLRSWTSTREALVRTHSATVRPRRLSCKEKASTSTNLVAASAAFTVWIKNNVKMRCRTRKTQLPLKVRVRCPAAYSVIVDTENQVTGCSQQQAVSVCPKRVPGPGVWEEGKGGNFP